ncbi:hypothetical protein [Nonomuraea cavernae]|uniref:Uncharacterized protein n=1 Tax=Nonomuraea cavernae TaxID=2045107 RepID=A0A917YPI8_9ACTN|nr:hypothetical protein [Nonomuraea cavernae]MCA2183773.1 hypothetical protein [Nonomuraea cavernae]GGO61321.1 hypothetical protein GCM10012289_03270 [Nonomuraea cavernae]
MSERALSLPEFSALVVLAVEAREISNSELKERCGLTIDGAKRRRLNELKLVDSWKQGRTFVHVLTDSGWARLAEDLRAGRVPAFTGSSGVLARALLGWLPAFLERTDQRLADVFQPAEVEAGQAPAEDAPAGEVPTGEVPTEEVLRGKGPGEEPGELEARVRAAYAELAAEPGAWVSLTRLRPLLGDAPRQRVDETLVRMERLADVNLVPESNQKALTAQDREAAVIIGDQDKHLLWIGKP